MRIRRGNPSRLFINNYWLLPVTYSSYLAQGVRRWRAVHITTVHLGPVRAGRKNTSLSTSAFAGADHPL